MQYMQFSSFSRNRKRDRILVAVLRFYHPDFEGKKVSKLMVIVSKIDVSQLGDVSPNRINKEKTCYIIT